MNHINEVFDRRGGDDGSVRGTEMFTIMALGQTQNIEINKFIGNDGDEGNIKPTDLFTHNENNIGGLGFENSKQISHEETI